MTGEYHIVSALVGLFWDVEHAALYKQAPALKRLEPLMRDQTLKVYSALQAFEDGFEQQLEISICTVCREHSPQENPILTAAL